MSNGSGNGLRRAAMRPARATDDAQGAIKVVMDANVPKRRENESERFKYHGRTSVGRLCHRSRLSWVVLQEVRSELWWP